MKLISNNQKKRDFMWLRSIRMLTKNGYITGDEDINRIMDYFYEQEKKRKDKWIDECDIEGIIKKYTNCSVDNCAGCKKIAQVIRKALKNENTKNY